jgi:FlaA1/EpsC-like NDP-sugar epimerase
MVRRVNATAEWLLRQRSWVVGTMQAALILGSLIAAWCIRFEFRLYDPKLLFMGAPILVAARLVVFARMKLLHGWWRYAGISDAVDIGKAVAIGSAAAVILVKYVFGLRAFPFSVLAIEPVFTGVVIASARFASRVLAESVLRDDNPRRLLLIGAGHAAQMLIRETREVPTGYAVVGCADDDPLKQRMNICGVPILGTVDRIPEIVAETSAQEILIAVPSSTPAQMRRFVELCERSGVPFRTVPSLKQILTNHHFTIRQIRQVELDDLLGREPIKLDFEAVQGLIENKAVMVTGAAGSIGSELCRQILAFNPSMLVCVDQNENGMFFLERELRRVRPDLPAVFAIADVGNGTRMSKIFATHRVDIIFHAAAYKHVPVMEANVQEAVDNNVFGLVKLLEAANRGGCCSFVLISSDKAVNPSSVMGATKRICELILAAWPVHRMRCVSVRFGNVLGSSGSVIPVFQEQLRNNQPITVTHPDIKRFFMTIPEAVSLVLQAFAVGQHGDILVLDMGDPIRIRDLAESLIRLSGKPLKAVPIHYTGLREGEKLYEELFYPDEERLPTPCSKVHRTHTVRLYNWAELRRHLDELRASMTIDGAAPVRAKIRDIVPQYHDPADHAAHGPDPSMAKIPPHLGTNSRDWRAIGYTAGMD